MTAPTATSHVRTTRAHRAATSATVLELADIQGNILTAYGRLGFPKARYFLFNVADPATGRAFVNAVRTRVTTALRWPSTRKGIPVGRHAVTRPAVTTNIAFTFRGLLALGLPTRTCAACPTSSSTA